MPLADARVGDEQVDVARLGDHPLDRGAIGDVDLHARAADLARDRFDLRAAARGDDHVPAIARQRASDARSDPTSATGHQRSHRTNLSALVAHRVQLDAVDEGVLVDRPRMRGAVAQGLAVGLAGRPRR